MLWDVVLSERVRGVYFSGGSDSKPFGSKGGRDCERQTSGKYDGIGLVPIVSMKGCYQEKWHLTRLLPPMSPMCLLNSLLKTPTPPHPHERV